MSTRMTKTLRSTVLLTAWLSATAWLPAQAFCSLRDPCHHIQSLYPNASSWQSLVASVDAEVRDQVRRRLPFTLSKRELGRHTLYVVSDEFEQFLGVVHARSESSPWGMSEFVWSLDERLRVDGLCFQRCRSPAKAAFLESPMLARIQATADFATVRSWLSADGQRLTTEGRRLAGKAPELAVIILRSAVKTMVATEVAWGQRIANIVLLGLAQRANARLGAIERLTLTDDDGENPDAPERVAYRCALRAADGSSLGYGLWFRWDAGNGATASLGVRVDERGEPVDWVGGHGIDALSRPDRFPAAARARTERLHRMAATPGR